MCIMWMMGDKYQSTHSFLVFFSFLMSSIAGILSHFTCIVSGYIGNNIKIQLDL